MTTAIIATRNTAVLAFVAYCQAINANAGNNLFAIDNLVDDIFLVSVNTCEANATWHQPEQAEFLSSAYLG